MNTSGRISIYQKLCIPQYIISDRLKFLFSVLYSLYCAEPLRISTYQKLCISQYVISDRLKFLFSVLCSLFLLLCEVPMLSLPSCTLLFLLLPLPSIESYGCTRAGQARVLFRFDCYITSIIFLKTVAGSDCAIMSLVNAMLQTL